MPLPAGGKGKRKLEAPSDTRAFTLQDVQLKDSKHHVGARHADSAVRHREMKTGISEASKRVSIGFHFAVTNCSHQTPGGGSGAAGAGATKDRPLLLRREQESIDYDMPDSSDTDSMTFPRTHYEAVAYPPLPTTRQWPTLLCRRQATAGRRSPWRQISVDQPTSRLLLQVVEDPEKDSFPATIANLLKTMTPELRTANNELPPHLSYDCSYPPTSNIVSCIP